MCLRGGCWVTPERARELQARRVARLRDAQEHKGAHAHSASLAATAVSTGREPWVAWEEQR
jgi:hypothetical protein